jgi:capsular polysaccharide transport system permease protein
MKEFFKKNLIWCLVIIIGISSSIYYGLVASDKYVSETNVVLESPQIVSADLSFTSLLTGGASGNDMLLLKDYLLSVDMLKILMSNGFVEHYSNENIDRFSRLHSNKAPLEEIFKYYLNTVSIEFDSYAGVLRIKVEAFSPEKAYEITTLLLSEGEKHMNEMGQRLADEQVRFLEKQVAELAGKLSIASNNLLKYQNENGLVSPTGSVESLSMVVSTLEGDLSSLQAKRNAIRSYQSIKSPEVYRLDQEIKALKNQIDAEKKRMASSSGGALNELSSEYQTLELRAKFAQESYSGALAALESTRIEAARKLKQVSVLQSPTLPEYPVKPYRLYNVTVIIIVSMLLALILNMLLVIVRDHRD